MATKKTTTTKKAPAKKAAAKRVPKKHSKRIAIQKIAFVPEREDFMTLRISRETVYWVVFGGIAVFYAAWIMQVQASIQSLYDDIETTSAVQNVVETPSDKKAN